MTALVSGNRRFTLPSSRDEAWKYTPVEEIGERLSVAGPANDVQLSRDLVDAQAGRHAPVRLVLVNGRFAPELSDQAELPVGVRLESVLTDATVLHRTVPGWDPLDGFDALNRTWAPDVLRLSVRDGVRGADPIQVAHIGAPQDDRSVSSPRIVVNVGTGSSLSLIETYTSLPGSALVNATTLVGLDGEADDALHRIQNEAADAFHIGQLHSNQQERSTLRVVTIGAGGAIARLGAQVTLAGPDAQATLTGLATPAKGVRHDTIVTVDHAASRCRSDQAFRSVVDARARSSFSGHVIVRPGTVATDAHQRSDSLLLSPDAQSDSRPWLEIYADDVRCDHGSATGRIDDDALLYMRSRGVPEALARQMLVQAFARSVTEQISVPTLRDQVQGWFEAEVDR